MWHLFQPKNRVLRGSHVTPGWWSYQIRFFDTIQNSTGRGSIDDELQTLFSTPLICYSLRSPNHKICFSFALKCIQNLHFPIHFGQFSPVSTQPHRNGRAWCKSYGPPREKLKHVLWLGDLKE